MEIQKRIEILSSSWEEIQGDFLCLQESFPSQVEEIAKKLDLPYYFHSPLDHEGPAILSKISLTGARALPLEKSSPQRSVVMAEVEGRGFTLASTHVSFAPTSLREKQLEKLIASLPDSFICGCDLNASPEIVRPFLGNVQDASSKKPTWPSDRKALEKAWLEKTGKTLPFDPQPNKIDYILYRGLMARDTGRLLPKEGRLPLSDHFLLWADFK